MQEFHTLERALGFKRASVMFDSEIRACRGEAGEAGRVEGGEVQDPIASLKRAPLRSSLKKNSWKTYKVTTNPMFEWGMSDWMEGGGERPGSEVGSSGLGSPGRPLSLRRKSWSRRSSR